MDEKDQVNPENWVDLYGDYLYRYALMRLRKPDVAQDAVQETLLAGVKGLERYDGRVDVKYWLRGILKNKIVDHFRKSAREAPLVIEDDEDVMERLLMKTSGIPTMQPKPWHFDPEQAYDRKEFWKVFESCMNKLNEQTRQVFSLKMLEGMKSSEVCKVLNISSNNLWVIMHRAREQMKMCLEKNWYQEG